MTRVSTSACLAAVLAALLTGAMMGYFIAHTSTQTQIVKFKTDFERFGLENKQLTEKVNALCDDKAVKLLHCEEDVKICFCGNPNDFSSKVGIQ